MHQWVRALETLRKLKKISKNQLQERGIMARSQYNTMLKAKKAPRFDVLERVLTGFGVTLKQFAEVYERGGVLPMGKASADKLRAVHGALTGPGPAPKGGKSR